MTDPATHKAQPDTTIALAKRMLDTGDAEWEEVAEVALSLIVTCDRLAAARATVEQIDVVCDDYAEGRIDAFVALGKIGLLRLYPPAAVPDPEEDARG